MSPLVVAVSGTSGAGKSVLVEDLSERLDQRGIGFETVHFDDFTDESDLPRGDVSGWLAGGGQPSEWPADRMERRLRDVLADRAGAEHGQAVSVVLVEEPFGRARPGLGGLIDLSVHLQVPLNVGLVRRLLRQFVPLVGALDESSTADLRAYLQRYLVEGAEVYRLVEAAAMRDADLVLDGRDNRYVLAEEACEVIVQQLFGHSR